MRKNHSLLTHTRVNANDVYVALYMRLFLSKLTHFIKNSEIILTLRSRERRIKFLFRLILLESENVKEKTDTSIE